jgi:hypothetical protein
MSSLLCKDLYTSFLEDYFLIVVPKRMEDEEKRMMLMMIESKQQLADGTGMCVRVKKKRWVKKKARARAHFYSKLTLHQSLLTMPEPT